MNILFLGTGAADWPFWPEGEAALDRSNRIRRLSSALIDGKILIDPSPATFDFAKLIGVDLSAIRLVLLTHSHSDHYNCETLKGYLQANPEIRFFCHSGAVPVLRRHGIPEGLKLHLLEPMGEFAFENYTVTALPGNHLEPMNGETCLHYIISDGEKKLYYGLDSGWFTAPEWARLMHSHLDMAVLDCTCGDYNGDFRLGTHNSIPMIRIMEPSIRQNEMLKPEGKIVLQHLARTLHKPNDQVEADMAAEGYIVAKDGLLLEV